MWRQGKGGREREAGRGGRERRLGGSALRGTRPLLFCLSFSDSWFNGLKLTLPPGTPYEFQCQYGSIGWSVGATLGVAQALRGERRVVTLVGDGSSQMTFQEFSTIMR